MSWLTVLWFSSLLPRLLCDDLLCFYTPILERGKPVELVATECRPAEVCFKAVGRYGRHKALSARGCMPEKDCGRTHNLRYKGSVYSMSYACCDGAYCNSSSILAAQTLHTAAALVIVAVVFGVL